LLLTDATHKPVTILFDDFVGAVGEVEGLGFAVVAHVEHAGAVDESLVAVGTCFGAGHSVHGDFDEGEGVEFDQGVIFPVGAGVGDEGGLVFGRKGGDVAFDGSCRSARGGCSAGGKENAQGEHEYGEFGTHRWFLHDLGQTIADYSMEGFEDRIQPSEQSSLTISNIACRSKSWNTFG